MKQLTILVLVLVLTLSLFTGCRSRQEDSMNTTGTTADNMLPDTGNMLPDTNDTIDPTNGANRGDGPDTIDPTEGMNQDSNITEGTTDQTMGENARGRKGHPYIR